MMLILLPVLILNVFLHEVSSAELCYRCLERCDRRWRKENCSLRYGEAATRCVSVQADSDKVARKQCMSDEQAEGFCNKFNTYEGVTCYYCEQDLCNSGKVHESGVFIMSFLFITLKIIML